MMSLTARDCDTIRDCIAGVLRGVLTRQDAIYTSIKTPTPAGAVLDAVNAVLCIARDTTSKFAEGWNARHCDPVRRLPVELSTECFRHLDFAGRLAVSHVSRAWRGIALADPGMWSAATITEETRSVSQELLSTLLVRSHPVSFDLAWKAYSAIPNDAVDIIIDNITRISSLKLKAPSKNLLSRLFQQPAPLLERLECPQGDCTLPATWGLTAAPSLKVLHLGTFSIPRDYEPLSTLQSFTGLVTNVNVSGLFRLYPQLVSLTLHNVTQPTLSHLYTLPDSLVHLNLLAGSFTKMDFSHVQEAWMGRRFRSLQLSYASELVPSIQLLTHGLPENGTWSMSVHDEILSVKLYGDDNGERYQVNFYDNVLARDAASGALRHHFGRLSALTTPMSTLLRFLSVEEPPAMPALRALTLVLNRETQLARAGAPLRAPHLREVTFTVHRDLAAYAPLLEAQYHVLADIIPAALPDLFAYDRPRLARVTVVGAQTEKLLARNLCALRDLADEVYVKDQETGACAVFVHDPSDKPTAV